MTKMNWKILLGIALMSVTTLSFTACGDDDDDSKTSQQNTNGNGENTGKFLGAKRVFGENLPKTYVRKDNGADYFRITMSYDANGFMTKILRERYGSDASKKEWQISYSDNTCTLAYYKNGEFKGNNVATIGSNGYMSEGTGDGQTMRCTYDGEYLTTLTVSESDKENKLNMNWQNGNIVQAGWAGSTATSISYTTTPNAGCVMQYDDGLDIDLDDWEMLYYIGLLGKGTTHLPQAYNKQKSSSKSSAGSNEWSVDDKGRAVKLVNTQWKLEDGHEYDRTVREYYWEW